MGNGNTKNKVSSNSEELTALDTTFKYIASYNSTAKISDDQLPKRVASHLLEAWTICTDEYLAQCTSQYLLKENKSSLPFKQFVEPFCIVAHETSEKKAQFLFGCLNKIDASQFAILELEKYVASILRSFIMTQFKLGCNNFEILKKNGFQSANRNEASLVKSMTSSLALINEDRSDLDNLEKWLNHNTLFVHLWQQVFTELYTINIRRPIKFGRQILIPELEGLKDRANYTPILDIPHIIFLNNNLPREFRHKWRFVFSSKIMGESFSTMLGKIMNKGATLLIIEDEDGYIFAGFAPESWSLSPLFIGDNTSMLFTLYPTMRCFNSSGYNDHYQYLNLNQQTMPNGLGMGGQFDFWGLWIDCDYGQGQSSKSCTTYRDYVQLSKQTDFKIRNVEVFALGDEPKKDEDEENQQRSVLDRNLEDRVILELSGKKMNSDGFRDPDIDL